jgi:hypothetical protein
MTEKELIHRAKVFQANSGMNGDKVSYSDACKIVLLSEIVGRGYGFAPGKYELVLIARLLKASQPWYRFW